MRIALTIAALVLLGGCANEDAYRAYLDNHKAVAEAYYLAASEPLLSVELPSPVKDQPYKIVVTREVERMEPQQIKDSEWAPVAGKALGVVGTVGAAYVISNAVVDLADSVGDAAGIHVNGDNARLSGVGNKALGGDHSTVSAGDHHESTVEALGMNSSADLNQSRPSTVSTTDTRTTTTTITDESGNTTIED